MFNRRSHRARNDDASTHARDGKLPTRDRVAAEFDRVRTADSSNSPAEQQLELLAFRPSLGKAIAYVAPVLGGVGLLLLVPYAVMTARGQDTLERLGFLALLGGWFAMVAIIVAGAVVGIAMSRAISSVLRRARRTDTFKLALGEAVVAAAGATFAAALVSGAVDDMMTVLVVAFVVTLLFTWAMLFPLYRQAWDAAADAAP